MDFGSTINKLFANRKFSEVIGLANQSEPSLLLANADAMAKVGVSQYLTGSSGMKTLAAARANGSIYARVWQTGIDCFNVSGTQKTGIEHFFYQYR